MPSLPVKAGGCGVVRFAAFFLAVSAWAQTAVFPGAVATNSQLGIASNVTGGQLAQAVGVGQ